MEVILMKKQYTKSYKIKMVEKYKKSKIKISEFCRLNEIPVSTFNGWLLENKVDSNNITNFGKIDIEELNNYKNDISNNTQEIKKLDEIKLIMPNVEVYFKSGCNKKILQSLLEAILID